MKAPGLCSVKKKERRIEKYSNQTSRRKEKRRRNRLEPVRFRVHWPYEMTGSGGQRLRDEEQKETERKRAVINVYTYGHFTPLMVTGRRDTFGRPILVILT